MIELPNEVLDEVRITAEDLPHQLAAAIGEMVRGMDPDRIRESAENVLAPHARAIERLGNIAAHASTGRKKKH